jgi:hypothetical protein
MYPCRKYIIPDITYDIISDMISYMTSYRILDMMWCIIHFSYFLCPAAADPRPAQRADETDDNHEPDRAMDIGEEHDSADKGPLTGMGMEEDAEILSLLLKHMDSSTMECPTSECPKEELNRTDRLYPVRNTADVRAGVKKARAELLNKDRTIKDSCIGKVIWYHIWNYTQYHNIIYDIMSNYDSDIEYDFTGGWGWEQWEGAEDEDLPYERLLKVVGKIPGEVPSWGHSV